MAKPVKFDAGKKAKAAGKGKSAGKVRAGIRADSNDFNFGANRSRKKKGGGS